MQTNKKPSMLYCGKKLINFSIFFQKIEFMKLVVKSLKNRKNIDFNVISFQYGVVMIYVLSCLKYV